MYAVHIKKVGGTTQTFDQVNNISVTSGRILIVVNNKMYSFRPGDIMEVRFCWNGYARPVIEGGDLDD